jgi:hypothetical protein
MKQIFELLTALADEEAAESLLAASGEHVSEWSTDIFLVTLGATGGVSLTDYSDGEVYLFSSVDAAIAFCTKYRITEGATR